jgi:hypothetical protein
LRNALTNERSALATAILAAEYDPRLAEECLANTSIDSTELNAQLLEEAERAQLQADKEASEEVQRVLAGHDEGQQQEEPVQAEPAVVTDKARALPSIVDETKPLEVRGSRVLRGFKNRANYARKVLDKCKAKFGTPNPTEANTKAVWRYAQTIMNDHGLRPSHQAEVLPYIVALTFQPTYHELMAQEAVGTYNEMVEGRFDKHLSRLNRWLKKLRRAFGYK